MRRIENHDLEEKGLTHIILQGGFHKKRAEKGFLRETSFESLLGGRSDPYRTLKGKIFKRLKRRGRTERTLVEKRREKEGTA